MEISEGSRRRIVAVLLVSAVITVSYILLWLFARDVVASETRAGYVEFENSFPLADTWLLICLLGATVTLLARRPSALLWLLAGGGAGVYLLGIDSLYDLENGIWWLPGGAGLLELAINLTTLIVSLGLLRWAWRRRTTLLTP
ncbi:hypothetical protein [Kutzneria sp. CA-103260]|uniref:hypothetical protein n=1 Tax=Kutzneria sp. CA-103260 TaxID=2802641 RepID=UPI001BA46B95|nr:hypothetical protein [Kutzneria sp. CA-103260]QUQ66531.1 hypothetical protein JJ691_42590 [Kutzneria sp. CA-103260]